MGGRFSWGKRAGAGPLGGTKEKKSWAAHVLRPISTDARPAYGPLDPCPVDPLENPLSLASVFEADEGDAAGSAIGLEEDLEVREGWRVGRAASEVGAEEGEGEGRGKVCED